MRVVSLAVRLCLFALLCGACQPKTEPKIERTMTEWTVTNHDPAAAGTALVWNGTLGLRISRLGLAPVLKKSEYDMHSRLRYEQSGEERIIGLRSGQPTSLRVNGALVRPADVVDYSQTMDYKSGRLVTQFTVSGTKIKTIWVAVEKGIFGQVVVAGSAEVELGDGSNWKKIKTGYGWKVGMNPATNGVAVENAADLPTESVETESVGITIDGPVEDQLFVRSALFNLRQSLLGGGGPVSPMMASSGIYFGHQFWDADVWVMPALALLHPDSAREIVQHRLERLDQARKNVPLALDDPNIPWGDQSFAGKAAMFPWESSVSGRETVPGSSKYQHHISGTVAWSAALAADLGLVPSAKVDELGTAVANFWLLRAKKRPDGLLGIEKVMSPDEYHIGDNDLYTNMVAQWVVDRYLPNAGAKFYLPRDAKGFLTYDGDRGKGYKQTAALLSLFPLQNPRAEAEAESMFNRYYDKTAKAGPAMSDSVHALLAARLGKLDLAYTLWQASWKDFTKDPLMLFSEKRRQSRTYFTTGAAGCINAVLYGFAGIRLDEHEPKNAMWSKQLLGNRWISIQPHLPKQWKQIVIKGLNLPNRESGEREIYDVTLTPTRVDVVRRP